MSLTGINWASRPTVQLVADINGGAGPTSTHQASTAWHELSAVLTAADEEFNQTMATAMGSWEGPGAESARASLSPFSEWAATAQAIAGELNLQTEGQVGAFTATRVSMPSMPEVVATEAVKDNMLDKAVGLLTGIPTPGELAEVVAAEQQLQSAAAMTFYDAAASRFAEYTPFLPAPLLTVAVVPASTSSAAVAYNGLGAHYSQDYTSTMTAGAGSSAGTVGAGSAGGTHLAHAVATGSAAGNSSGSLAGGAHSGGAVGGGAVGGGPSSGSHSQGSGSNGSGSNGSGSNGSGSNGAGGAAHSSGAQAGTARTYATASNLGGLTGSESGSLTERGLVGGSGAGSAGHGEAGRWGSGPAGSGSSGSVGAFASGSGVGGGSSLSSGGGAGGSGGAGSVSSASDTATRGSLSSSASAGGASADGGARGLGNAGSATAGGRGGVGSGTGAGRGRSEDEQEHEIPDYLKDLEHFSDGRVVAPPVIGVDDVS